MKTLLLVLVCVAGLTGVAAAQSALNEGQGHPLKGIWIGDWGPDKAKRTPVLIELNWDGKAITGAINPGPNALPLTKATLDSATWMVHLEAERKEGAAKPSQAVIDGRLENIGAYRRVLSGTWTQNGQKGQFRLVLN